MDDLQTKIPYERINLLLPQQRSRYSDLYNVYNDLFLGLKKIGIESEILLINFDKEYSDFPYFNIKKINLYNLKEIIYSKNEFFVTVDDFRLMYYFFKNDIKSNNLLIWAHYFYGHKFIFERYKKLLKNNFGIPFKYKLLDFIPLNFLMRNARFYYTPLKNNKTVAQSLWTDLLLERVYNIFTQGLLYIPVEYDYYNTGKVEKINRALIYLGGREDADLYALKKIVNILKEIDKDIEFDYFGDEYIGEYFNKKFNENILYVGKLERKDLSIEYARHLLTISPIYVGTFEMVPIQSLLCGTPVITYIQPFMEVTGQSNLIANIYNSYELKRKFKIWQSNLDDELNSVKKKILSFMDNRIVSMELMNYLL
ncbi:MAG: hypothetical protein ACP5IB_10065 [Thermoplasmata archaeon]|jgi:hypothetical protein